MRKKNLPLIFFDPSDGCQELREEPKGSRQPVDPGSCLHSDEEARDGAVTCPPPSTSLSRAEAESPTTCTAHATLLATPLPKPNILNNGCRAWAWLEVAGRRSGSPGHCGLYGTVWKNTDPWWATSRNINQSKA